MRKALSKLTLLIPLLIAVFTVRCSKSDSELYDTTANFEFRLSESVAKVANLTIVSSFNDKFETYEVESSFAKTYSCRVSEDESGTILMLYAVLSLKDNYKDIVSNMSESELESFYNSCQFKSELRAVHETEDVSSGVNITTSDIYKGGPKNSKATTEKVIETLEKNSNEATPLFILNINKEKTKWSQIYAWDAWGETFE